MTEFQMTYRSGNEETREQVPEARAERRKGLQQFDGQEVSGTSNILVESTTCTLENFKAILSTSSLPQNNCVHLLREATLLQAMICTIENDISIVCKDSYSLISYTIVNSIMLLLPFLQLSHPTLFVSSPILSICNS
ncbi:hypothetical protein GBA52_020684 [Prunus armeniaca]|nr:hypothetical protein GBA52_020684 [Prunus armeniaca]